MLLEMPANGPEHPIANLSGLCLSLKSPSLGAERQSRPVLRRVSDLVLRSHYGRQTRLIQFEAWLWCRRHLR